MFNNEYFIFVNLINPLTRHNLKFTGHIQSAGYISVLQDSGLQEQYLNGQINYLPFVINEQRATNFLSFYCASAMNDYRVEYDAEMRRLLSFPRQPSRLSSVYAFPTKEDCIKVNQRYKWNLDSVRKFTLLQNPLNKVARVNMEIVSLMRSAYRIAMFSAEEVERVWAHYWSGQGNLDIEVPTMQPPPDTHRLHSSGEIWECLIEGNLQLQGDLDTPIRF